MPPGHPAPVRVLVRGLEVMVLLNRHGPLTTAGISQTLRLARTTETRCLAALEAMEGKADVFYLTRSWGTTDDTGKSCGEVWGRGIRLRLRDAAPPMARSSTEVTAVAVPVGVSAAAPTPPTSAAPSDKSKMGF